MDVSSLCGEFYFWNFGKENNLNYRNHFHDHFHDQKNGLKQLLFIEIDEKYDWDLAELQTDHHPIRTEYETAALEMGNKKRLNPETGEIEAFISNTRIYPS